jgi:galactose mutarotase-like enzyme
MQEKIFTIQNDFLLVQISTKGAELQSLINKTNKTNYLWNGDASFWGKKSPVLFPIVGGLKNNTYQYKGTSYTLGRHGFARDKDFELLHFSENEVSFCIENDAETLLSYPFEFKLIVQYTLKKNSIICNYLVENKGDEEMYFSIGAHPAFALPILHNTNFEDWYLQLNEIENCGIFPLAQDGLLKENSVPFFNNANILPLHKSLFYKDALVFKNLRSNTITIKNHQYSQGLTMYFEGFNYFGIWSAKDANFICLEPWLGIADSENSNQQLTEKEGINILEPHTNFQATWSVALF